MNIIVGMLMGAGSVVCMMWLHQCWMVRSNNKARKEQIRRNEMIGDIANAVYWKLKEEQDE